MSQKTRETLGPVWPILEHMDGPCPALDLPALMARLDPTGTRLELRAQAPSRNIDRRYGVACTTDLFGHIIVALHWGRIGTRGQRRTLSFPSPAPATAFVRATLQRRATAPRRIGVPYRVVEG